MKLLTKVWQRKIINSCMLAQDEPPAQLSDLEDVPGSATVWPSDPGAWPRAGLMAGSEVHHCFEMDSGYCAGQSPGGFWISFSSHQFVQKLLCVLVVNFLLFKKAVHGRLMSFSWGQAFSKFGSGLLYLEFSWWGTMARHPSGKRAAMPASWSLPGASPWPHHSWALGLGRGVGNIRWGWVKTLRRNSLPLKMCRFWGYLNFAFIVNCESLLNTNSAKF